MTSLNVLTFDAEGRAVDFEVWLDDLQLFLQCDSKEGLSLFDLTSGASTAPTADADSTVRSQWLTRDAAARLAVRNHLPSTERSHLSQYKSARALYDAVVARYSSPTTAALSRLMLPYLFPDLAAISTVADLVAHLCTSATRYRAALPTEFLPTNSPPMGVPLSPFSPLLLLLLLSTSLTLRRPALRLPLVGDAALARAREAGVVEGAVEAAMEEVEEVEVVVGVVPGVGASEAAVAAMAVVAEEAAAAAAAAAATVVEVAEEVVLVAKRPRSVEALVAASVSSSCAPVRPRLFSSFESGTLGVGGLGNVPIFDLDFDAILAAMYALADITEGDCYLSVPPDPGTVAAALGASVSAAPGASAAAALGASMSTAPGAGMSPLTGTAPTESLHTFTLDSGASRSFFRDSTTLTPLRRPVAVSLADPSKGPVLAHSSTVLPCPAAPSGLLSGLHLPSFSTNLVSGADLQDAWVDQFTPGGSSLYTLTTAPPPVSASGLVAASSQVFAAASRSSPASAPCSCRPLAQQTLLWHHRLGHPSLPRLRVMASHALVSDQPRSLLPLPPGPAPTCVPCVEGRQRAAPHSSSFPSTEAPLQTLHMDVWGPARVRGQGHERYFLLVVDDYSRYTTVFPLRTKGEVPGVLIDWIRGTRRQLNDSFGSDLRVLRLHSDRGGTRASDQPSASFRVWGSRAFVRDTAADKLSFRAVPCVFLGFLPDAPGWQFYHPTSRRVLSSQDVTFHESVSYYCLFPYRTASPPTPAALHPADPVEVAVDLDAAGGAKTGGAESGGAETGRAEPGGAETGRVEPARAASGGALGVPSRREPLSPQRLRGWYSRRCRVAAGAAGAGAAGGAGGASRATGGAAGAGAAGAFWRCS
ncbi:unnamed protein product, partial [Closterium sp. NIES-53]